MKKRYNYNKESLPRPILDGRDDFINLYYQAWELAFKNLRKPHENTGFVSNFIDTAFDGCTFMWDSVFMLMFGKYADRIFKFQKTLDNFYSHQHVDGFICRQIEEETGLDVFARHDPASTGPEVMTWCEWEYYLNFGDKERLSRVFYPLLAYHNWMAENHTWRDGTYWSTGWGCGMDNMPRLESGYHVAFSHGHMVWVDACIQQVLSAKILVQIAEIIGRAEDAEIKELNDKVNANADADKEKDEKIEELEKKVADLYKQIEDHFHMTPEQFDEHIHKDMRGVEAIEYLRAMTGRFGGMY